jgi:hypothetical protein
LAWYILRDFSSNLLSTTTETAVNYSGCSTADTCLSHRHEHRCLIYPETRGTESLFPTLASLYDYTKPIHTPYIALYTTRLFCIMSTARLRWAQLRLFSYLFTTLTLSDIARAHIAPFVKGMYCENVRRLSFHWIKGMLTEKTEHWTQCAIQPSHESHVPGLVDALG